MKKVLSIFGTRPEAIKMAPVVRELEKRPEALASTVCVTAQHREMLDQVLNLFGIRPNHDLGIMESNQDLFGITCGVLGGLKKVLETERPDLVLVHGDTCTTLAAAMAAFYLDISVGHVEAGLRTGDRRAPWPEEVNRKVTGCIADLHFAPTESARLNLISEGVDPAAIHVTGNTVVDALNFAVGRIRDSGTRNSLVAGLVNKHPALAHVVDEGERPAAGQHVILVTGHRRESFGRGLENVCSALLRISHQNPNTLIVYPVHPNPNVSGPVKRILGNRKNILLTEPLDYLEFVLLMEKSSLILTDSGGVQEEAPSLGKPVLVMRDSTERPEAMHAGKSQLVGTDPEAIVIAVDRLMTDRDALANAASVENPFGDGQASVRIASICDRFLNGRGHVD